MLAKPNVGFYILLVIGRSVPTSGLDPLILGLGGRTLKASLVIPSRVRSLRDF